LLSHLLAARDAPASRVRTVMLKVVTFMLLLHNKSTAQKYCWHGGVKWETKDLAHG
jgi:hypothetical protein